MKQLLQANKEQGFVLISAMFFLVFLTVIGILATDTTTIELQIASNDRIIKTDFYNQEMSLAVAKVNNGDWLTTDYLTTDENLAYFPQTGTDTNSNGINDLSEITNSSGEVIGSYRVRNIVSADVDIANWEDKDAFGGAVNHPANQVPILSHRDKPIPGSGYDPKNFEIRRFSITAYSLQDDRKVILQEGVFKAFNNYN